MAPIITIQTKSGPVEIPTVWAGDHLAVHRPWRKGGLSKEPRLWVISHRHLGLSACSAFEGTKARAVELARLWDAAFDYVTEHKTAKGWRYAQTWAHDLAVAQRGTSEIHGPILPDNPGYADVAAAMAAAHGATYEPAPADGAQYPAKVTKQRTGAGAVRRNAETGELELWWLPRGGNYPFPEATELAGWYPVPTLADVEAWCLDSVAETPSGDCVEPDHPDAWPRLLGLI